MNSGKISKVNPGYCKIKRCELLFKYLKENNVDHIKKLILVTLDDLESMEKETSDRAIKMEVFEVNMRTLHLLLEYSDIFSLRNFSDYKDSCLRLIQNFKRLMGIEDNEGSLQADSEV